eukprot:1552130-Alexandrium_andersonii.AAC.1
MLTGPHRETARRSLRLVTAARKSRGAHGNSFQRHCRSRWHQTPKHLNCHCCTERCQQTSRTAHLHLP